MHFWMCRGMGYDEALDRWDDEAERHNIGFDFDCNCKKGSRDRCFGLRFPISTGIQQSESQKNVVEVQTTEHGDTDVVPQGPSQGDTLPAQWGTVAYSQGSTLASYPASGPQTVDVAHEDKFEAPTLVVDELRAMNPTIIGAIARDLEPTVRSKPIAPVKLKRGISFITTQLHTMNKLPRLTEFLENLPNIPDGDLQGNEMDRKTPRAEEDDDDVASASQLLPTSPEESETRTQIFRRVEDENDSISESLPSNSGSVSEAQ